MAPLYYRNAMIAILVFDLTVVESFVSLKVWYNELKKHEPDILVVIAGNKSDLKAERKVSQEEICDFADSISALHFETSAKDSTGVEEMFAEIVGRLVSEKLEKKGQNKPSFPSSLDVKSTQPSKPEGGCCA
eukprot:TRINITY_DN6592_c0_g1_i1.p1 TRINITY_DN6592_c0_g1~~TRINITY_DN6592_c0_g1_i1.p1  ORF type:complete len:132 (+),score=35.75 TRINITY_DN6592_c0_g1_i1:104-499(+)